MSVSLMAFFFYLLASMGFSIGADNIGDSLSDIIAQQDTSTQVMIYTFLSDPGNAIFTYADMGLLYLSAPAFNKFMEMQHNGVTASELNAMGIDYSDWLNSNQGNVNGVRIGTLAYKITNELGQTVIIDWVYDDAYYLQWGIDQYILTLTSFDTEGNVVGVYDMFNNSRYACVAMNGLTAEERVKLFVNNSYFSAEYMAYYCINDKGYNFLTLDLSDYMATDVALEGNQVYDDEYAPIGTVTVDGEPYNLNPDGSVTIDGTTYYPNTDGTVTVGENTYDPVMDFSAYNDTALLDLLRLILRLLYDMENALDWEEDTSDDVAVNVEATYQGTLSEFILSSAITKVFPFCLPFDFVRGIKLFSEQPEDPVFTYIIRFPAIGSFEGVSCPITIDFTPFEPLAVVMRWTSTIGFVFMLIFTSRKIVKGA